MPATLPRSLVLLLAGSAALSVAALYYCQPMLGVLGADLGASTRDLGFVPTLTQLGYALGILLLAPLGDRYDRRRIILIKAAALLAPCCWPRLCRRSNGCGWPASASAWLRRSRRTSSLLRPRSRPRPIGMATGAALGSLVFAQWGWIAVTGLTTAVAVAALVTRLRPALRCV